MNAHSDEGAAAGPGELGDARLHPGHAGGRLAGQHFLWRTKYTSHTITRQDYTERSPRDMRWPMSLNNATVKPGQAVGFEQSRGAGESSRHQRRAGDAVHRAGRLRRHTAGDGGSLHGLRQQGHAISPLMVQSVRDSRGDELDTYHSDTKAGARSRVAYVLTTMMERDQQRHGISRCGRAGSPRLPRARQAPRTTPGSPDIPAICCALSGWATTITAT